MFFNQSKNFISLSVSLFLVLIFLGVSTAHHPARSIDLSYKINFDKSNHEGNSDRVELWIPIAKNNNVQEIKEFNVSGIKDYKITSDIVWGNRMIYFSALKSDLPEQIVITYSVKRKEYSENKEINVDKNMYLQPSKKAVHSDRVKRISNSLVGDVSNSEEIAKIKYDFIVDNMKYDKSQSGSGDVEKLCIAISGGEEGAGTCTDYHSLFTSLLQVQNIPTRVLMGVPLKPQGGVLKKGYHCWAEFLAENGSWYPVDLSEADKNYSQKDFFYKPLDHDRFSFSMGRDVVLNPAQSGKPLNFFGPYPYGESKGQPFKDFTTTISYN